jgi:hypothetical protein
VWLCLPHAHLLSACCVCRARGRGSMDSKSDSIHSSRCVCFAGSPVRPRDDQCVCGDASSGAAASVRAWLRRRNRQTATARLRTRDRAGRKGVRPSGGEETPGQSQRGPFTCLFQLPAGRLLTGAGCVLCWQPCGHGCRRRSGKPGLKRVVAGRDVLQTPSAPHSLPVSVTEHAHKHPQCRACAANITANASPKQQPPDRVSP